MGACASVPKGMRAEAMAAPPPEHPKEENTTTATTTTAPEVVEVKEGSDNAEPKEDEKVAEEKGADDKHQSLGSLLNESEAAKESAKDEKSSDSNAETKESKDEELPVSDAAVAQPSSS
ncbi:uncharacterized protein LOC107825530 [Nicotiana tabacum]|uniref:Uncharacterized protein LOC107825530 n=2 Tax=Nicotiana TaxID=4085 RepID=A0A1S4D3A1_TOBAC|nr:PREDICTED: uncharacterized protein LOC104244807 [Nicotiana sylvestris]XP_016507892.1 PREDICTED: uncharacterized protein LOC107825530 [Nicotiana tabacum]